MRRRRGGDGGGCGGLGGERAHLRCLVIFCRGRNQVCSRQVLRLTRRCDGQLEEGTLAGALGDAQHDLSPHVVAAGAEASGVGRARRASLGRAARRSFALRHVASALATERGVGACTKGLVGGLPTRLTLVGELDVVVEEFHVVRPVRVPRRASLLG